MLITVAFKKKPPNVAVIDFATIPAVYSNFFRSKPEIL